MAGNISQVTWELPDTRCYYVAAGFWRTSLYLVIAGLIFGPLLVAVDDFVQRPDPINPWVVLGASLLFSLFFAQFLFIYLKVDQHGISRRIFWRWDLWPWEAFADGSVEEADCYCYRLRSKPIWRQRVALVIDDAESVNNLILRIWKRPEPEPIPDAVSVQMQGGFDPPLIVLRSDGLVLTRKKSKLQVAWMDLHCVTIWRSARYRRDFHEIDIALPDATIVKFRTGDRVNWTGASREAIAGILRRNVPTRSLRDYAFNGPAVSIEEADARHDRILLPMLSSEKGLNSMIWFFWLGKCAAFAFAAAGFGVLFVLPLLMLYGCKYSMRCNLRRQSLEYEAERASLLDAAGLTGEDDVPLSADDSESPPESQPA